MAEKVNGKWQWSEAEIAQQIEEANQRGLEAEAGQARAVAARYDAATQMLFLTLRGGTLLLIPARLLQGIAGAPAEKIAQVEVLPGGSGLHWEELDADFLVQGLVAGSFGTRQWMEKLASEGALDAASLQRLEVVAQLQGAEPKSGVSTRGQSIPKTPKHIAGRNGATKGRTRKKVAV